MYIEDVPEKGRVHILVEGYGVSGTKFKTYKLFISAIFHLMFLDGG